MSKTPTCSSLYNSYYGGDRHAFHVNNQKRRHFCAGSSSRIGNRIYGCLVGQLWAVRNSSNSDNNKAPREFPEAREAQPDDIIAVDFDGTLVMNAWPKIGTPIWPVIEYVKHRQKNGARLILWTNRCGKLLDKAIAWCKENGIVLSAVNENLPDIIEALLSE